MIDHNSLSELSLIAKYNCNLSKLKLKFNSYLNQEDKKPCREFFDSLKNVNLKKIYIDLSFLEKSENSDSLLFSLSFSKRLRKLVIHGVKLSEEISHSIILSNKLEYVEMTYVNTYSYKPFINMIEPSSMSLQYLNCSYCNFSKLDLLFSLTNIFSSLKILILDGNKIGNYESPIDPSKIRGCDLEILSLQNCGFNETSSERFFSGFLALSCVNIESFIFNGNKLGVLGTERLTSILMDNKKIKILSLENTSIATETQNALGKAIVSNEHLSELNLNDNRFWNNPEFFEILSVSKKLTKLSLARTSLDSSHSSNISKIVKHNLHLKYLDISSNGFIQEDVFDIFDQLKGNPRPFNLVLYNNPLNYQGLKFCSYISNFPSYIKIQCSKQLIFISAIQLNYF